MFTLHGKGCLKRVQFARHVNSVLAPIAMAGLMTLSACVGSSARHYASIALQARGSFFVGGESKKVTQPATDLLPEHTGEITVNQMYVQYEVPSGAGRSVPIVLIHGCCLSSKTWETTPDGREGWSEYFVRQGRPVYLVDQVSRARSGFDPTVFGEVRAGELPEKQLPEIISPTHQFAWLEFRWGPKYGEAFSDEQFPTEMAEEFYKQMIPDLNSLLDRRANPTWVQLSVLAHQLNGAVLVGHSESGFFPEHAALIEPNGIRGIVSIETVCETDLTAEQIAVLAKIPTLLMFGDHLGDVALELKHGRWTWQEALKSCNTFADQLRAVGGDVDVMHLPELGIRGNSHMLMQDKNSDQLGHLVLTWIDRHVRSTRGN